MNRENYLTAHRNAQRVPRSLLKAYLRKPNL